ITILMVRSASKRPSLTFGWAWYLVTLLPVIGIIQVGGQSHADRYTYVPLIGLFIIVSWGLADLAQRLKWRPVVLGASAAVTLIACAGQSIQQIGYWKDSVSLFTHALAVTRDNELAENNLGSALAADSRLDEAVAH